MAVFIAACAVLALGVANGVVFALLGSSEPVVEKEIQFAQFLKEYDVFFVNEIAQFFHSKSPFLHPLPYSGLHTDSRISTWFAPPHQVVMEWLIYTSVFLYILLRSHAKKTASKMSFSKLTFHFSLWTLLAIAYFKIRAGWQLGEWFNVLYLLQPCHVLLAGYTCLAWHRGTVRGLRETLWDIQWFAWFAIAFPDTEALNRRNLTGELFLFYFEHALLVILPFACLFLNKAFPVSSPASWKRPARSVAWAGLYHIQVMTPLSLLTGTQLNYQTHLPAFAMKLFPMGRAYKALLLSMYFVLATVFALWLEPLMVKFANRFRIVKKIKRIK